MSGAPAPNEVQGQVKYHQVAESMLSQRRPDDVPAAGALTRQLLLGR